MKMPPLEKIEISIPEEVSLRLRPRQVEPDASDDASETSEISLDILREKAASTQSGSTGSWDPDYSLSILLPANGDDISATDSDRMSLMTSDYSLTVRIAENKKNKALDSSETRLTNSASQSSLISNRSTKSSTTDTTEETTTKPERKVKFYPRVRILRVTNRKDLPKSQIKNVWYSRDEFRDIRKDCFETIRMLQEGELIDEEEGICVRGLEYKTTEAYKERQRNKIDVRQAVFEEQEFQQEGATPDPIWIARVSREQSRACVEAALEVAKNDEKSARLYLDTNESC